ncbi:preprotein translocase subunit SecG [Arenimonas sp.]|uniref:preprotein translocase subunit SecG n=1 Tax=Arenimonas sp. TaxID=1872635 RepID=UPI0039E5F0EC
MLHTLLNVVYVLIAIAMIVFILLQRGAGAQAGSGFGAGASGTVFGARGSANFLSSSTKVLAALFFALSLFMAWQATHGLRKPETGKADLGVMNNLPAAPGEKAPAALPSAPALPAAQPAPAQTAPAQSTPVIAPAPQPANSAQPTPAVEQEQAPAEGNKGG